jgi:large subunit ribosomal protein L20
MPRVKRGVTTHKRHKNLLALTKGFRNGRRTLVKRAKEASLKAGQFAYRDRRTKKRMMRRGWIVRINAAVREHGMSYSALVHALKQQGHEVDRRVMDELIQTDRAAFDALVKSATKN